MSSALPTPRLRSIVAAMTLLALAACGPATLPSGATINDPTEVQNRGIHQFNVAVDRALIRPVSLTYGTVVPEPVRDSVSNFSDNLDQPRHVVNNLLQFRLYSAAQNTFRFLVNSTFGFGGLFDPATDMGILPVETDFGETLHVWGVEEGAYVVLPVLGPSTSRDTAGFIVDRVMNPTRLVLTAPESDYATGATVADAMNTRYRFADTIDGLYYDSADSYSQARLLFLQNRRFELRGNAPVDYADPYEDPYSDPYEDPYEDPYAQ